MTTVIAKGTILEIFVSAAFVPIAQVLSVDLPEAENETFEADVLDNSDAGIPHEPTGRTEGGTIGWDMFLDPVLASFTDITDKAAAPALTNMQLTFADAGGTVWPFSVAGFKVGGTIAMADGVKASCSGKLNGIVTYP